MDLKTDFETPTGSKALKSLFSQKTDINFSKKTAKFFESPEHLGEKSYQTPSTRSNLQDTRDTTASTQRTTSVRNTISPIRSLPQNPFILNSVDKEAPSTNIAHRLQEKLKKLEEEFKNNGKSEPCSFVTKLDETTRPVAPISWDGNFGDAKSASIIEDEYENPLYPTLKYCAFCQGEVMTDVSFKNSSKTFWSALGIFMIGGVFGCFMLPYMTNTCKEAKMACHICKRTLS